MLWDLDELADDVRASLAELADVAGVRLTALAGGAAEHVEA